MGLITYALKRLALLVPMLLAVTLITFLLTRGLPGNPSVTRLGETGTQEMRLAFEEKMGLNKPILEQYLSYLYRLIHGDWGTSWGTGQPVIVDITIRFPATLELSIWALVSSLIVGIPLAVFSISRRNKLLDKICSVVSFSGVSIPSFWFGLVLVYIFFYILGVAPAPMGRIAANVTAPETVTGLYTLDSLLRGNWEALYSSIAHIILPSITLGFVQVGIIVQTARSAMMEILKSDYIRAARAAGFSKKVITYNYAFRNSLPPLITKLALNFGFLISGVIVVEKVFAWPGMGSYALNSAFLNDYEPMVAYVLITTVMYVLANLAADLACATLDPKIKYD